jgi:hypothetical protein
MLNKDIDDAQLIVTEPDSGLKNIIKLIAEEGEVETLTLN